MAKTKRNDQTSNHSSPGTGKGRIVISVLAIIVITNIYFPDLMGIEKEMGDWYEPQWVSPDQYKDILVATIEEPPRSRVIWGFGTGKRLQATADTIQNHIYDKFPPSCIMWIESDRFNWQTQEDIFNLMSCGREAIVLQIEGPLVDRDLLKFTEMIVNAPEFIHYNGKKRKPVPVTIIAYTSIAKSDIRRADEIVQESLRNSWSKEFLDGFVSVLVVS